MKTKWKSHVFRDKPRYCRMPIFLGGERQIHIMQPFNEEGIEATIPTTMSEWVALSKEHGQIVFSHEGLDDFIIALQKLKTEQLSKNEKVK